MAGVQWSGGKLTRAEMHATLLHDSKDTRLEHIHSNEDIDPKKTPDNWSVLGRTYSQKIAFFNERMSQIDVGRESSGSNERVVCQDLIIYCPPEIEAQGMKAVRKFFKFVYKTLGELVGVENVLDVDVHVDEQHYYVDPDTGEMVRSRIHGHMAFIPVVSEKDVRRREKVQATDDDGNLIFETVTDENGNEHQEPVWERTKAGKIKRRDCGVEHVVLDVPQLNVSQVATRASMTRANKLMDEMCEREFGCSYTTGKGRKRRGKTMEQLKIDSAQAADDMLREAEDRVSEAAAVLAQTMAQVQAAETRATEAEAEAEASRREAEDAASQVSMAQEKVDAIVEAANAEAEETRSRAREDALVIRSEARAAMSRAAADAMVQVREREAEAEAARDEFEAATEVLRDAEATVSAGTKSYTVREVIMAFLDTVEASLEPRVHVTGAVETFDDEPGVIYQNGKRVEPTYPSKSHEWLHKHFGLLRERFFEPAIDAVERRLSPWHTARKNPKVKKAQQRSKAPISRNMPQARRHTGHGGRQMG